MEGDVQSRTLAPIPTGYYFVQNGHSYKGDDRASATGLYLYGGDQVTQSYRSKRGIDLNSVQEGFTQESGSQGAFQKELADEARSSGVRSFLNYGRSASDNGHEFATLKHTYEWFQNHSVSAVGSAYGDLDYVGYIYPVLSPQLPTVEFPTPSMISMNGARLFKSAQPDKPEAGLMQFMFETRQDMPRVLGAAVIKGKGVSPTTSSEEFLNLQFGLIPTWSDLQKLSRSVLHSGKLLRQYHKNANRNVRRSRSLPSASSVTETVVTTGWPVTGTFFDMSSQPLFWVPNTQLGVTTVTDVSQTDAWFSGAFTYYLNEGHSILDRLDRYEAEANHLLGTRFSADTFWELSPFSWLADWYSDTGTFMSNVVALDNDELAMRYGYVMHETRATRTYLKHGLTPKPGSSAPTTLRTDVTITQKLRHRSSPYGFGLVGADLTLRQKAILGALGITQGAGSRWL